jgi:hypothetical protein
LEVGMSHRAVVVFAAAAASLSSAVISTAASPMPGDSQRSGVVEAGLPQPTPPAPDGPEAVGRNVNTTTNQAPQNETSMAVDPGFPLNVVGGTNDYRHGDVDAGFAVSLDGGKTWFADTLAGVNPALGKYDAQGDPAVAAYRSGIFYYAFIDFNRNDDQNRLAVAKSFNGGQAWSQLGVIADHQGPGSHDFEDKEYIAVDNTRGPFDGNVYVTWTRFPVGASTRIMVSRSTDGGMTFSAPLQISDSTNGYQGSLPVVGPDGEIYVSWLHNNGIELDRSTDGGLTWGTDILASTLDALPSPLPGALFRNPTWPFLAVDRSGGPFHGNLYIVWADETRSGVGPDLMFIRSTDRGVTWSSPRRISDDTNGEYQWFPWISVDPHGAIHVVFFDRRDAPGSQLYHTYYTRSRDGGATFSPNVRLSEMISDASLDGFGGGFIGDYNGLASSTTAAHPYWTDVRVANANAEGYTVAATPGPLLAATGTCPGTVNLRLVDATPLGTVRVLHGTARGSFVVPGGPCAGTELGLAEPRLLRTVTADAEGRASGNVSPPQGACGRFLQVLDQASCETSNVAPLP